MRPWWGLFLALLPSGAAAQVNVPNLPTTNSPATITSGNAFQTVLPALATGKPPRRSLTIENNNSTDNCWIAFGTTVNGTVITAGNATKAESIVLLPGGSYQRYYPYIPSDEIEGTCATSNDTLYIDYQQ